MGEGERVSPVKRGTHARKTASDYKKDTLKALLKHDNVEEENARWVLDLGPEALDGEGEDLAGGRQRGQHVLLQAEDLVRVQLQHILQVAARCPIGCFFFGFFQNTPRTRVQERKQNSVEGERTERLRRSAISSNILGVKT